MNSKNKTIINSFVLFSSVLLSLPVHGMAWTIDPAYQEMQVANQYPAENLAARLQRLTKSYNTHISFDAASLRTVRVQGAPQGKSIEEDLRNSL